MAATSPLRLSSAAALKASSAEDSGSDRDEGAHSLPAYIHPPIPVETLVTHPHSHHQKNVSQLPPEMKNAHRSVLFFAYASASAALATTLPATAAAVALLATVWLSFVFAVSFTEAWVKFRAPTLSKAAAVDAGRHVFAALNSVESGLAVGLVAALVVLRPRPVSDLFLIPLSSRLDVWRRLAAIPLVSLVLQVSWLTPSLDRRARELIVSSWKKKKEKKLNGDATAEDREEEERARAAVLDMELRDGGTPVPPAWTHAVYVVLEAVKVVSLALLVKSAGRSFV